MRQLDYIQVFLREPFVSRPSTMTHRDVDVMYDDLHSHLVSTEV